MGFDLLTGVFALSPLALFDKRPGVTLAGVLKNWGLVFVGNFMGALTVAVIMSIVFTYGFSIEPSAVGQKIAGIGEARTLGYKEYGAGGHANHILARCSVQLDGFSGGGGRNDFNHSGAAKSSLCGCR